MRVKSFTVFLLPAVHCRCMMLESYSSWLEKYTASWHYHFAQQLQGRFLHPSTRLEACFQQRYIQTSTSPHNNGLWSNSKTAQTLVHNTPETSFTISSYQSFCNSLAISSLHNGRDKLSKDFFHKILYPSSCLHYLLSSYPITDITLK